MFISLSRQCLVLPIIFLSQFGFLANPSHCHFIHPHVYQPLQTLSCLAYNLLPSIWIFVENLSFCHLLHQSVYQSFQTVSRLACYLLRSILIVRDICLIVISHQPVHQYFPTVLVLPMIFFSQIGFSRKSVLF